MRSAIRHLIRVTMFAGILAGANCLHAQYVRIQLRVYGLDCELCARGVAYSVMRLDGVNSVAVHLKQGTLDITLKPDNKFKMSSLRKRIQDNGFRPIEATVTANGKFNGSRFEVFGTGESYEIEVPDSTQPQMELTFNTGTFKAGK